MTYKDAELVTNERHWIKRIFSLVLVQLSQNELILPTRLPPSCQFTARLPFTQRCRFCIFLPIPSCRTPLKKSSGFSLSLTLKIRALLLVSVTHTLDPHWGSDCPLTQFQISCPSRRLQYTSPRTSSPTS